MDARELRGMEIAAVCRIDKRADGSWAVPSMSGNGRYTVKVGDDLFPTCTCADYENRRGKCKHIWAVEFFGKRETTANADGSTTVTETVTIKATKRETYPQNWPAYNKAQTNEGDQFQRLLAELCDGIEDDRPRTTAKGGRPPLPLSSAVFAVVYKVYSTFSGRRFMSDLRDAHAAGRLARLPHFNSIFNYLEREDMTPVLTSLIAESSRPLAAVESVFSVDSSGFSTCRFTRWFDHKYGIVRQDHDWVKAHVMCGVNTNVVTAVEIHERNASDTPQLPALLEATTGRFKVAEVVADKAYASVENFTAVDRAGASPYVAFKTHHTGRAGGLFAKAFHFFNFRRDDFLRHYHKRSNAESTFSMVKAKFGDAVRSKTDVAMKNEALCKFLCHNICCLISAFYELGIEATFWPDEAVAGTLVPA